MRNIPYLPEHEEDGHAGRDAEGRPEDARLPLQRRPEPAPDAWSVGSAGGHEAAVQRRRESVVGRIHPELAEPIAKVATVGPVGRFHEPLLGCGAGGTAPGTGEI